ncbi:MAG: PfkB family carbohydrate kinase [Patescibacteria group bacterium]
MKILGIGESVIDTAYIATSDKVTNHVGGPSPIALMLLARLGIETTMMTTLGNDPEGQQIKQTLIKEGVRIIVSPAKKTKVNTYHINPQNGSRKKVRGNIKHAPISNLEESFIQTFDLIIIDRHEHEAFYEVLKKKNPTAKILIDPSTEISAFTLDMIKYADYPIIPIESVLKLSKQKDLVQALRQLQTYTSKPIIITAGALGSIILEKGVPEVIPAIPVQAIDVQGAGDVYRGAFAYGIVHQWNIPKAVAFANMVAGLHCTKLGNASALPTKESIMAYQKQLRDQKMEKITEYLEQAYE